MSNEVTAGNTFERERLAECNRLSELLLTALRRAERSMYRLLDDEDSSEVQASWANTWRRVANREERMARVNATRERNGWEPLPTSAFVDEDSGPSRVEQAAEWHADALEHIAKRARELHRIDDGQGVFRFIEGCIEYARLLRVAAAGRWPEGVEDLARELQNALDQSDADARRTAKGVLRVHELKVHELREAGQSTLVARMEFECRHTLAELQRIISVPEAPDLY